MNYLILIIRVMLLAVMYYCMMMQAEIGQLCTTDLVTLSLWNMNH